MIVDLTEVPFYASAGMTLLIDAARRAAQVGRFAVVADGPHTARRMLLLGLGDTFDIHPDLDTAVAALTG